MGCNIFHDFFFDITKVPDWIQAIGVVISLFFLNKTLRLQRETFEAQQAITIIEQKKFRLSFLPLLSITIINKGGLLDQTGYRSLEFEVSILANYLQSFSISHNFPLAEGYQVNMANIIQDGIYQVGDCFGFTLDAPPEALLQLEGLYFYSFSFEDAIGNRYSQRLIYRGIDMALFLQPATLISN